MRAAQCVARSAEEATAHAVCSSAAPVEGVGHATRSKGGSAPRHSGRVIWLRSAATAAVFLSTRARVTSATMSVWRITCSGLLAEQMNEPAGKASPTYKIAGLPQGNCRCRAIAIAAATSSATGSESSACDIAEWNASRLVHRDTPPLVPPLRRKTVRAESQRRCTGIHWHTQDTGVPSGGGDAAHSPPTCVPRVCSKTLPAQSLTDRLKEEHPPHTPTAAPAA